MKYTLLTLLLICSTAFSQSYKDVTVNPSSKISVGWCASDSTIPQILANQTLPNLTKIWYWDESAQTWNISTWRGAPLNSWSGGLPTIQTARAFLLEAPSNLGTNDSWTYRLYYQPYTGPSYTVQLAPDSWYFLSYAYPLTDTLPYQVNIIFEDETEWPVTIYYFWLEQRCDQYDGGEFGDLRWPGAPNDLVYRWRTEANGWGYADSDTPLGRYSDWDSRKWWGANFTGPFITDLWRQPFMYKSTNGIPTRIWTQLPTPSYSPNSLAP